ncbi:AsmA family protein [Flavobacterium sp. RHBU_3]|uniref:AsmA family protein n=1 Tax=Flavobacterium sp. RHBU_3 TaxID=3391184 RepID=UPI0039853290
MKSPDLPRHHLFKIAVKAFMSLILLFVTAYLALALYIYTHKAEVQQSVTESLNKTVSGKLTMKEMDVTLVSDFPGVGLKINGLTLTDSLYPIHKHTFLKAGTAEVAVNTMALLRGTIQIKKISLSHATIDLYTDANGYCNSSVFPQHKAEDDDKKEKHGLPELKKVLLNDVLFTADNKKGNKLYKFKVHSMKAALDYNDTGLRADVNLGALAESMAFNTVHGSFIEGKTLEGTFDLEYNKKIKELLIHKKRLDIGGEHFMIGGKLSFAETPLFHFTIENKAILWKDAATLLSQNISKKLLMFDIKKPIRVACDLIGDFNAGGDPLIQVNAEVKDNELETPGGLIKECNFFGVFTNNRKIDKGYNDANSAIKLFGFTGKYEGIPFTMPRIEIRDLEHPLAVGSVTSSCKVADAAGLIDDSLLKLGKGSVNAALNFRADVDNFKLVKPVVQGEIKVKDADITYAPRKLPFNNISVALRFNRDSLYISKVALKMKQSVIVMNGSVSNFLNLYYKDPEKLVLNWNVYSPQLHLGEFMAFLQTRNKTKHSVSKTAKSAKGGVTAGLDELFEKCSVHMKMKVDKLYYKKFLAENATANLLLNDNGTIVLKHAGLYHAGGSLDLSGTLNPGKITRYAISAQVKNVNLPKFMYAFNNFGLESLTSRNISGAFSARADVTGGITQSGSVQPRSVNGVVTFKLADGKLVNFDPIVSVGKFAFPFRDVRHIEFKDLKGRFDIQGEKVQVAPMQISSSVLNMDVEGVYSFGKGTLIYIDVPLRNPEKDKGITDQKKLAERRNKGIVVHLKAEDDETGKVKIKLGKRNRS